MQNFKKGFTLIELLVVMAIIGILAALALTSFNTAQKNSRDTRRKSDLQQYRNALEAYASNNNGEYPIYNTCTSGPPDGPSCLFLDSGPIITEYLPARIDDPINVSPYRYIYRGTGGNGIEYKLWGLLETETNQVWMLCSNGKVGKALATSVTNDSVCNVP